MSQPSPLDFYFEFASPYGYLASLHVDDLARRHGREVVWRPIMLGAVFKLTGSVPNAQIPLKGDYLLQDVPRFARRLGVQLTMPEKLPMNSLAASRAYYWLLDKQPQSARPLPQAIFHAHWGEGRDMSDAASVADLGAPLGIERSELLAAVADSAIKERLKAETKASVDRGVFGSPFIFVDDEPFWGADRLDQVERWLAQGGR